MKPAVVYKKNNDEFGCMQSLLLKIKLPGFIFLSLDLIQIHLCLPLVYCL